MTAKPDNDLERVRAFIEDSSNAGTTKLPPESKLSEMLAISRGRLRTILKRLEDENLIWRHVGKGTFIGQRELTPADDDWLAAVSVNNIVDARLILEPQLAAQAAIHATETDIQSLEQCIQEMEQSQSFSQWKRLDARLHRSIAMASHNSLLLLMYDTLRTQVRITLDVRIDEVFGHEAGPQGATDQEHRHIIDAIKFHQPERAEAAMRNHLTSVRAKLFGLR